jgi:hypothetical protein
MSDIRALREKIDQVQAELRQTKAELDKQRTQHARDQKSLHEELEDTRHEASRLRSRLEKAEERERKRVAAVAPPVDAPAREESRGAAGNMLVALARTPGSMDEALPVLSKLLRMSPADVRMRLGASQPSVLARLPDLEAEMLRDLLAAEGFGVVCADMAQLVGGLAPVRRFAFEEQRLVLEDMKGAPYEVPYSQLRLLVRGRRKSFVLEKTQETQYDPAIEARVTTEHVVKHPRVENFLWVYGGSVQAAFTEATNFAVLGPKRGLTKHDSLQSVLAELRQRAPQVILDERLLGPSVSLPMVGPERSQEVLAGLLDQFIQAALWP